MQPLTQSGNAAAPVSDGLFNEAVPAALKALIDRFGVALLGESTRLRGLLQDDCPQSKKEISILLQALEERVPQDLLRVHSGEPVQSLSPRLSKRLADEKAMSVSASRWAVHAWAHGLGVEHALPAEPPSPEMASAANEPFSAASQPVAKAASPLADKRVRIGLAAAAALVVVALGWWMLAAKVEVTRVDATAPLVGNGRPIPVFIEFEARNFDVRSVEVRFVRGDGTWNPSSWRFDVGSGAAAQGRAPAGTLQYATAKPMSSTFEYTLVGANGKRSTPFERTFDILPPIAITDIKVPRPLRVGREFAVTLQYQKGTTDVVQVERKVVDSNVPWAQPDAVQQVKLTGESGRYEYKFDAFPKPTKSTVEFVLIDANGVRSDPVRVALDVASAATGGPGVGTVLSIAEVKQKGEATGVGAVIGGLIGGVLGRQVGGGRGRDVSTVAGVAGGAYAGHEIEKNARSNSSWDTTVRFDDGSTRVIRTATAPRWRVGERVHFGNGTLTPAGG